MCIPNPSKTVLNDAQVNLDEVREHNRQLADGQVTDSQLLKQTRLCRRIGYFKRLSIIPKPLIELLRTLSAYCQIGQLKSHLKMLYVLPGGGIEGNC